MFELTSEERKELEAYPWIYPNSSKTFDLGIGTFYEAECDGYIPQDYQTVFRNTLVSGCGNLYEPVRAIESFNGAYLRYHPLNLADILNAFQTCNMIMNPTNFVELFSPSMTREEIQVRFQQITSDINARLQTNNCGQYIYNKYYIGFESETYQEKNQHSFRK